MASILTLSDDLLEAIGIVAVEHVGIKAWCRLTSTCRRLWRLHLPASHHGVKLPSVVKIEGTSYRECCCAHHHRLCNPLML